MVFENARQYVRGDRIDDLEDLGVVFVHCIEVDLIISMTCQLISCHVST